MLNNKITVYYVGRGTVHCGHQIFRDVQHDCIRNVFFTGALNYHTG